jgi:DNA-binding NarL/FixJ family response regulator
MSVPGETFDRRALAPELAAVAEAAGARLRGEVAEDRDLDAAAAASDELLAAATAAISANYSLMEIAQAEARGKETVRRELGGDALKRVERTGRQARDAEAEHHRAIGRAMRLGLSMREIALAAGVTHGTIRAIGNRLAENGVGSTMVGDQVDIADAELEPRHTVGPSTEA